MDTREAIRTDPPGLVSELENRRIIGRTCNYGGFMATPT